MKKQILTIVITALISIALFGGTSPVVSVQPIMVEAQSSGARTDLITKMRQDAQSVLGGYESFRGHREELLARNITWADGDFVGSNAGITGAVFTQAMVDFEDLRNKTFNGGTISVGVVNNVYKIK